MPIYRVSFPSVPTLVETGGGRIYIVYCILDFVCHATSHEPYLASPRVSVVGIYEYILVTTIDRNYGIGEMIGLVRVY